MGFGGVGRRASHRSSQAVECYLLCFLEALGKRLVFVFAVARNGNDSSAVGHCLAVESGCAAVENDAAFHLVDAFDGVAFPVSLGIAAADEHHAHCCTVVELHFALGQIALSHTLEQVDDVAFQPEHHAFCLGVAHSTVVFDDHWIAANVDKAEEDKAFIVDAFLCQTFNGGADDALFHLVHPLFGGERHWRHAAHAAGVQSGVALSDALVVLCFGQYLVVLAIGEHEYRALYAAEKLLDDHPCRGIAEHSAEHLLQLLLGFVESGQYEHTLSGAQSVGLEHVWRLQCLEESYAFGKMFPVEGLIASCRYGVPLHESLGKVLGAFHLSSGLRRAYHWYVGGLGVRLHLVVDAFHQRVFGAYDHHVDVVVDGKSLYSLEVVGLDSHVAAQRAIGHRHASRSGIAGCYVEVVHLLALSYLPCQGVFASAAAQE